MRLNLEDYIHIWGRTSMHVYVYIHIQIMVYCNIHTTIHRHRWINNMRWTATRWRLCCHTVQQARWDRAVDCWTTSTGGGWRFGHGQSRREAEATLGGWNKDRVDGCWWMLMDVDGCWWMLMDVDGCWWILMDVDGCWWMLMDVDGCWWWSPLNNYLWGHTAYAFHELSIGADVKKTQLPSNNSNSLPHPNPWWMSGWWFGCHFLCFHILGIIIPIDFHIFQRGGPTTNQMWFKIMGTTDPVSTGESTDAASTGGDRWFVADMDLGVQKPLWG